MNESHGGCPFAHSGGDSLDRPVAHVASGEDARDRGFEPERITGERPAGGLMPFAAQFRKVWPGQNETVIVSLHDVFEPFRMRLRTDKDEERIRPDLLFLSRRSVEDGDRIKMLLPMRLNNGSPQSQLDVLCPSDLLDQVMRHFLRQRV